MIALICTLVLILLQPTFQEDQALLVTANTKNVTVWPATIGTIYTELVNKNAAQTKFTPAQHTTVSLPEVSAPLVIINIPPAPANQAIPGAAVPEIVSHPPVIAHTNTLVLMVVRSIRMDTEFALKQ